MSDTLDINHVRVGDRHRKDFGDLDALASSIRDVGLLGPIVVDADNNLVAGHRRLEACRKLGWPNVPVRRVRQISDAVSALKAERDENTCRKDFTPSEAVALGLALEEMEKPKAALRVGGRPPKETPGKSPEVSDVGEVRAIVAPAVGLKPRRYTDAKNVVLAMADPDPKVAAAAAEAVAEMDATGNVNAALRKVKQARGTLTTSDKIVAASEANPLSRDGIAAKVAKAKQMAAEGYTSRQIGEAIGVKSMGDFRQRHGVEVPADAVVGKRQHLDSNRIVSETVSMLEGAVMSLDLVNTSELDPARIAQWATSLTESLSKLRSFQNRMKEMALVPQD